MDKFTNIKSDFVTDCLTPFMAAQHGSSLQLLRCAECLSILSTRHSLVTPIEWLYMLCAPLCDTPMSRALDAEVCSPRRNKLVKHMYSLSTAKFCQKIRKILQHCNRSYEIGCGFALFGVKRLIKSFRLAPKSMTLNDKCILNGVVAFLWCFFAWRPLCKM